jgi:uncharacterized protein (TIGR04255 family)
MDSNQIHFRHPSNVKLSNPPLVEAWLEVRWELEPIAPPHVMRDPAFAFALGRFYEGIKDRFPVREPLEAAEMPEQTLPYVVRYRFRVRNDKWPLLQIGPGIASVNVVTDYSWTSFSQEAANLRKALLQAYEDVPLKWTVIALRYRNVEIFDYESNNALDFLKHKLNISFNLPTGIPGEVSKLQSPSAINSKIEFELQEPNAVGALQTATVLKNAESDLPEKAMLWELSVVSKDEKTPNISQEGEFMRWLDAAHAVIHEWFLSLTKGELLEKYGYHVLKDGETS